MENHVSIRRATLAGKVSLHRITAGKVSLHLNFLVNSLPSLCRPRFPVFTLWLGTVGNHDQATVGARVFFQVSGGFWILCSFLILLRVYSFSQQRVSQDTDNLIFASFSFNFLLCSPSKQ